MFNLFLNIWLRLLIGGFSPPFIDRGIIFLADTDMAE